MLLQVHRLLSPGKGWLEVVVFCGRQDVMLGMNGSSPLLSTFLSIQWQWAQKVMQVRTALPEHACRGVNQWIRTSVLLKIYPNAGPSTAQAH